MNDLRGAVAQWLWTANEQWARGKRAAAIEGPRWEDDADTHEYWRSLADALISRGHIRQEVTAEQVAAGARAGHDAMFEGPFPEGGIENALWRGVAAAAFRAVGIEVAGDE